MHSEIFMIRSYESDTGYDRPTYRATNAHGKVEFYNDDIDGAQDEQNYTGREVVVTFDGANYINDIHLNN